MTDSLPTGWTAVALGNLVSIKYGKGLPERSRDSSGNRPVIGSAGIVGRHRAALVDGPVLVVGRKGNVGAVYLAEGPCWPIDTTYFLNVPDEIDGRFLYYQLQASDIAAMDSSTAVPSLRRQDLESLHVVLAPTGEQPRIVAVIEEQFSRIDAGVEALQRARRNLQRMRAAVLQAAVTGRLVPQDGRDEPAEVLLERVSEERSERWNADSRARPYREPETPTDSDGLPRPEHWAVASLEQLTDPVRVICYGILKPRVPRGTIPYVEVRDLAKRILRPDELNKTSEALHRMFSRSMIKENDVLLAIRGSYDRAAVAPAAITGANISRDVARIAPLPGLDPQFLRLVLTAPQTQATLASKARGVGVKGVNIGDIRRMLVPVPPKEEQRRIVEQAEQMLSLVGGMDQEIDTSMRRAATLRRALLAGAFAGNLVPQDPSDEPANFLLDRIKATRTADDSQPHRPRRRSRR